GTPSLVRSPAKTAVSPLISPAASSATSPSRSLTRTCAPCSASSSAVARPIPRAEPVTIAALPSSTPTYRSPCSLAQNQRGIMTPARNARSVAVRGGDAQVAGVRARPGRLRVPAVDRAPEDHVELPLRDLVDRAHVEALHRPAVGGAVRVARVDVVGGLDGAVRGGVRGRGVERVVQRR